MTQTESKDPPKPKGPPWPRVESKQNGKVKPNNNNIRLKRPLSAYNLFYQDERRNVLQTRNERVQTLLRQQHGNMTDIMIQQQQLTKVGGVVGLTNHVASKWNALDDTTKRRYYFMAALEKARYRKVKRDMKKHNKMTMMMKMQKQDMDDDTDADNDDKKKKEIIENDGIQTHGMVPYSDITNDCRGVVPPSHSYDDGITILPLPILVTKPSSSSSSSLCPAVQLDSLANVIFQEHCDEFPSMDETSLIDMSGSKYSTTTTPTISSNDPMPTLALSSEHRSDLPSSTTTTADGQTSSSSHWQNWRSIQQLHFALEDEERDFFISSFYPRVNRMKKGTNVPGCDQAKETSLYFVRNEGKSP